MHPTLRAVADRQFGAFASRDAVRVGCTYEEVQREVARGRWVRLRRGVYAERAVVEAAGGDPVARHRLECAAVLVRLGGRPVVSHASAARLGGLVVPSSHPEVVRLTDDVQWRRGRGYDVARATLPSSVRWAPSGSLHRAAVLHRRSPVRALVAVGLTSRRRPGSALQVLAHVRS